ncbi:hypothetical protein GCM10022261_28380 [Brevibacterium daeguense]|uniref:DNA-binding protein n=1 Tax=Brevibacterium daeguense TaxID=909936 RepID=A0ABP8END1_9MICO|nr:DNA-binding protein [Brevibacterium daeguense]
MGIVSRLIERFGSRDAEAAADIQRASAVPDTVALADVVPRARVRVAGVVVAVTRSLPESAPQLDIIIRDGTGAVAARFLGRREIAGVLPGRVVALEGRFGIQDGQLLTLNPAYQLVGAPPD